MRPGCGTARPGERGRTEPCGAVPSPPPSPLPRRPRSVGGGQTGLASPLLRRAGEEAEPAAAGCFRVCFEAGKPGAQPARTAPSPGAKFRCGGSPPSPTPPGTTFLPGLSMNQTAGVSNNVRCSSGKGPKVSGAARTPLSFVPKHVSGSVSPPNRGDNPLLFPPSQHFANFSLLSWHPFGVVARGGDDRIYRD